MQLNPITNILGDGFTINATIEGSENRTHDTKHIIARIGFEAHDSHFIITSEIHQKLGTFS